MDLQGLGAFLAVLSPQACKYVLQWLVSPWTMSELVVGEPDGMGVLRELMGWGVLRLLPNGLLDLSMSSGEER